MVGDEEAIDNPQELKVGDEGVVAIADTPLMEQLTIIRWLSVVGDGAIANTPLVVGHGASCPRYHKIIMNNLYKHH